MNCCRAALGVLALGSLCPAQTTPGSNSGASRPIPKWAQGASWYYVDVESFVGESAADDKASGGSLLQRLQAKLPYIKDLGVQVVCLSPILDGDGKHVRAAYCDGASIAQVADAAETDDANAQADQVDANHCNTQLEELVAAAHKLDLRVAVDIELDETALKAAVARFSGRSGDAESGGRVDGWLLTGWSKKDDLERAVAALEIAHAETTMAHRTWTGKSPVAGVVPVSVRSTVRYPQQTANAHAGANGERNDDSDDVDEGRVDEWRLETAARLLMLKSPMTMYGDEIGLGWNGEANDAPMPWTQLQQRGHEHFDRRHTMLQFYRMLLKLRSRYAPLRQGEIPLKLGFKDGDVGGWTRSMDSERVSIIFNTGVEPQRVKVSADWPRQMVLLLSPQMKPAASPIEKLRIGASRQEANEWGDVSVWVKPKSFRLVVISDNEPR